MMVLKGRVEPGQGDAGRWLARFHEAYSKKMGIAVFPGSLNLRLSRPFDWFSPALPCPIIPFPRAENGGERDILLLPCLMRQFDDLPGYLWTTTNVVHDVNARRVVEIIAPVGIRETFGVRDGSVVEVELVARPWSRLEPRT
jgi:CTP-dependent riboflavin kinase